MLDEDKDWDRKTAFFDAFLLGAFVTLGLTIAVAVIVRLT